MKHILYVFALVQVMSLHAQTFQPGIKAGVNISNFTGGNFNSIEKKSLVGFHAGGLVRFHFGTNLALQPEVVFSSQGAKLGEAGTEENFKISYVNIPVLLQYHTNNGFFVEAGPQVGFKISEDIPDNTIEDFAKSTDFSIAMGLGFQSKMGLGLGARYNVGVSKVGNFDASILDPDFKNGVIQISLFYTFFNKR